MICNAISFMWKPIHSWSMNWSRVRFSKALVDDLSLSIMRNNAPKFYGEVQIVYQFKETTAIKLEQSDKDVLSEPFSILISGYPRGRQQ